MALDSFPNTPHNNRAISLAENEQLLAPLGGSGLVGYTGITPVYADSTGRQVKVRAGVHGWIRGTKFTNITETIVNVTTNTSGNPRVDLLVARVSRTNYGVTYVVIPGAASATPLAPQPVRNDTIDGSGVFDLPLAEIKVANAYTTVAAGDVKNRAWWLSLSGYQGFAAAPPPVEPGALFRANDAGITYIGTAGGAWQKIYNNGGWVGPVGVPAGWNPLAFHFCRVGDLVVMNVRIIRTGAAVNATTTTVMGNISASYRPAMTIWGVYRCTNGNVSHAAVTADGEVQFAGTVNGVAIASGANLLCNMVWPVAEP